MPGKQLTLPGGVRAVVQVRGQDTSDAMTVMTDQAPAGWRLPPHRHRAESETIHVTSGRLWMVIDGQARVVAAGETAHIPAGILHEGGTEGSHPVSRLVIFVPGGMDRFFEKLAQTGSPADGLALAASFGWEFRP